MCADPRPPDDNSHYPAERERRPRRNWSKIIVGLVAYVLIIAFTALSLVAIPDSLSALRGLAGMAMNGLADISAFLGFELHMLSGLELLICSGYVRELS